MDAPKPGYRAGMVALVGRPNVGKSTLLNTLVGQKISIVSDKPQTTRRRLLGVVTTDEGQIALVDTPGVHKAHTKLGHMLNAAAREAISGVDLVVVMVDSSKAPTPEDTSLADMLRAGGWLPEKRSDELAKKVLLCMNKMDLLKAMDVVDRVAQYSKLFAVDEDSYMLTSLTRLDNVEKLRDMILARLPEGPPLFDDETVTDQPMRLLAADLIREKVLRLTRQEVPHAVAVKVDQWEEGEELIRIHATILVEKDSQRGILIGKQGQMLRRIGTESRSEIEELTGSRVYLELFVKVFTDWRQNPRVLSELDSMA